MIGYRGSPLVIPSEWRVFVRMQGHQIRLTPDASGVCTLSVEWMEGLRWPPDGSPVEGAIWIDKTKQHLRIFQRE